MVGNSEYHLTKYLLQRRKVSVQWGNLLDTHLNQIGKFSTPNNGSSWCEPPDALKRIYHLHRYVMFLAIRFNLNLIRRKQWAKSQLRDIMQNSSLRYFKNVNVIKDKKKRLGNSSRLMEIWKTWLSALHDPWLKKEHLQMEQFREIHRLYVSCNSNISVLNFLSVIHFILIM